MVDLKIDPRRLAAIGGPPSTAGRMIPLDTDAHVELRKVSADIAGWRHRSTYTREAGAEKASALARLALRRDALKQQIVDGEAAREIDAEKQAAGEHLRGRCQAFLKENGL